jgi:thiamine monophosphate synthase
MDFILMLTRADRTIDDAESVAAAALELGIRHVGFKDVGASAATMQALVQKIRACGGTSYLEVVSTTSAAIAASLERGRALGVDCILGGTDLTVAARVLGNLAGYFPFPGEPVGHPTQLRGSPDPIQLVRAARDALAGGRLIVAGSVNSPRQIHALAAAGADAFTIGSAIFDGSFSPARSAFRDQVLEIFDACESAPRSAA